MKVLGWNISFKRQTSPAKFDAVNITSAEAGRGDYRAPANIAGFLARYTEYVAICSDINATNVAAVPQRLYRKKRKGGKGGRAISGERRKYLKLSGPGRGPGAKAATYATSSEDIEEVTEHPAMDIVQDPSPKHTDQSFAFWHVQHARKEACGNAFYHVVDERGKASGRWWLFEMFPQHMAIEPDKQGGVRYYYGRDPADRRVFPADEVLHEMHAKSLFQPIWGAGPLEKVLLSSDIYNSAKTSEAALFGNGSRPDGVLKVHENSTTDEMKRYRDDFNNQFRGADRRGRVFVVRGEAAFTPINYPPKEMEYKEGVRMMMLAIANAYGIPFTFLDLPNANLASSLAGDPQYTRQTLHPRVCRHAEWLTETILPLYDEEPGEMWFAPDNVIPEDEKFEVDKATRFVAGGIVTINEARAEHDLEPIDGGDVLRVNGVPLDVLAMPSAGVGGVDGSGGVAGGAAAPAGADGGEAQGPEGSDQTSASAARDFNGAQVTSAKDILTGVSDGTIAPDAAVIMLIEFFGIAEDRARSMVEAQAKQREQVKADEEERAKREAEAANARGNGEAQGLGEGNAGNGKGAAGGRQGDRYPHNKHRNTHDRESGGSDGKAITLNSDTERAVARTVQTFTDNQLAHLFSAMQSKPMGYRMRAPAARKSTKDTVDDLLKAWGFADFDAMTEGLAQHVKPLVRAEFVRTAEVAAAQIKQQEPSAENFSIENPNAVRFAKQWEKQLLDGLEGFNRTTAELVGAQIAEAIEAGEGVAGMERRIRETFAAHTPGGQPMTEYRASMIARTETSRAKGRGEVTGWAATEVIVGREWLLSANPCEFCAAAYVQHRGKPVPLDEPYFKVGDTITGAGGGVMTVDFADVWAPSELHPHCACTQIPVIGKAGGDA